MKLCVFFFAWFFNCNGMFCFWASTGILLFYFFCPSSFIFTAWRWYCHYSWDKRLVSLLIHTLCMMSNQQCQTVLCCHHILQNQQFEWQCGPLWVCRALVLMELLPLLCNVMRKCRRFIVILSFLIWWWLHIAQTIIQNATKGAL